MDKVREQNRDLFNKHASPYESVISPISLSSPDRYVPFAYKYRQPNSAECHTFISGVWAEKWTKYESTITSPGYQECLELDCTAFTCGA
jgi:hypothetical protein